MTSRENVVAHLERLARLIQSDAHDAGLRPTQWEALRYLARANRFSRSPSAVTAYLGMTKGTVSQTLMALERKGLIGKKELAVDRRVVTLQITAKGKRTLEKDPLARVEAAVGKLKASETERLEEGLQAVLTRLLRDRDGRAFGACKTCRHFGLAPKPATSGLASNAPFWCGLLEEPLSQDDSEQICVEQEDAA
ncbi:MAG: MarR family winged helix-turn-helix transcriptional regulator [Pseudomonadota bacterium]